MTLVGLMLMALVVDLGGGPSGERLGFRVGDRLIYSRLQADSTDLERAAFCHVPATG